MIPSSRLYSSVENDIPSDVNDEETVAEARTVDILPVDTIASARDHVLKTSQSLLDTSLTGVFLSTPSSINKLDLACRQLEAVTPPMSTAEQELALGEWDLVCTARAPKLPLNTKDDTKKENGIFDLLPKPPKVQDTIRNSLSIRQRIRTNESVEEGDDEQEPSKEITRVDHVLEYTPLTLKQLIAEDSPLATIRSWNVNPLEISKSKVTLIHTASVESISPVFRTKLNLQSVVVTVAGTSSYLDPEGADLLGLNIPSLGEWSNSGYFDTTFVDESLRISRGSTLGLEELRVFVKSQKSEGEEVITSSTTAATTTAPPKEERAEKVKEAVKDVKSAVVKLDEDVKTKVQDAAKEVQELVKDDLKEINDKVAKVREAVVGKETDVEDVVQEVEAVVEEEEDKEKGDEELEEDELDSDSSANEI